MNQEINVSNSNNKVLITIVVILIVLVLCLGGYLVYDKLLSNNNDNNTDNNITENNQEETKEEDYDLVEAKKLIDNILSLDVYNILDRLSESGLTEDVKLSMAIVSTPAQQIYTCNDAFDVNTEYGGYRPTQTDRWACDSNIAVDTYPYNDVNESYKKLFGSATVASKNGVYTIMAYDYSSKIDSFVALDPQFGPIVGNLYYYDVEAAQLIDNQLIIEVSYLTYIYTTLDAEDFTYTINDIQYTAMSEEEISKAYNDNKEILPHLTFTYEKENKNYVLKSVN